MQKEYFISSLSGSAATLLTGILRQNINVVRRNVVFRNSYPEYKNLKIQPREI